MNNNFTKKISMLFGTFFLIATILIGQCPDPEALICDDFEDYTLDLISAQAAHWTPWGFTPGATDDAIVSTAYASSGTQSLLVSEANGDDMLLLLGDQTEGQYQLSWKMYVPSGNSGYFNTQKIEGNPGGEYGMQTFLNTDGTATLDSGGEGILTYNWTADSWMDIVLTVDLDNDWIVYTLDGVEIYSFPASYQSFETTGIVQLGSINFYGWTGTVQYIDDVLFEDLTEPTVNIAFNVNMANETVAGDGVYIAGEMNNWNEESMIDVGNGTWSKSYEITVGDTVEYVYSNGSANQEDVIPADCTLESTVHRYVIAGDMDMDIDLVCYNECTDCVVGTEDLKFSSAISISPNPAKYTTNLLYDFDQATDLKINLLNNLGQRIKIHSLQSVHNGNYSIDLDDLSSGIYFLHVTNGENSITEKLIVE